MQRISGGTLAVLLGCAFLLVVPAQAQYVGVNKCRPCHLQQYKSWQQTRMANAFELLKPGVRAEVKQAKNIDPNKDYTNDPECLTCHTTGYGQPGGFTTLAETPKLAGIQCEVCHGPGENYLKPDQMSLQNREYKRADLIAAGLVIPTEETCTKCHNEKSPFFKPFNFEERKQQGTHEHLPLKYPHE